MFLWISFASQYDGMSSRVCDTSNLEIHSNRPIQVHENRLGREGQLKLSTMDSRQHERSTLCRFPMQCLVHKSSRRKLYSMARIITSILVNYKKLFARWFYTEIKSVFGTYWYLIIKMGYGLWYLEIHHSLLEISVAK